MLANILTERLLLRQRTHDDLEDCLLMDCDPLVTQFIPGPWSDATAHRAFVIERIERHYPSGFGYWVVEDPITAQFLGWVFLLPYQCSSGEAEMGWRLNQASWGQGFATEAASGVLKYAFKTLNLRQVVVDIHAENSASIRVSDKLGMRYLRTVIVDGAPVKFFHKENPSNH